MKRGGGRRYYRPDDIDLLRGIRHLLYGEGYTIRGVQRILREQGAKFVQVVWQEGAAQPPHGIVEDEDYSDEAADAGASLPDEDRGLRGRLSSLIGRDLGDRQDDAADRADPPLTGAPVPRIDPVDRAIHDVTASEPSPQATEAAPAASRHGGLARDDLRKLHAALHELAECRKLIDAAVTRLFCPNSRDTE
jgi:DNA-binding transcriptional MerR regulator